MVSGSEPKQPSIDVGPVISELAHIAATFWWLWLILGGAWALKFALDVREMRRISRSGIADIDAMSGREFEEYLATLFARLGYSVTVTRYRGDYGADLVVERDAIKTAVQAKCWRKRVGLKAVQEVEAARAIYGCQRALVVTNRGFTDQARTLAAANGVELWDREILVTKLLQPAVAAPRPADSCVVCGAAVSDKVIAYCRAHAARFGGQIYCYEHQRSAPQRPPADASV